MRHAIVSAAFLVLLLPGLAAGQQPAPSGAAVTGGVPPPLSTANVTVGSTANAPVMLLSNDIPEVVV